MRAACAAAARRGVGVAASASWEAFRTAACVLAGRAARQSSGRWEMLPEIASALRNRRGRPVDAREGFPRTRASLDPVDRLEKRRHIPRVCGPAAPPTSPTF